MIHCLAYITIESDEEVTAIRVKNPNILGVEHPFLTEI